MARYAYERLSNDSAALLEHETSRQYAHTSMVAVFEAGALGRPDGGVHYAAIRSAIESKLAGLPHYRRKLRRIPLRTTPSGWTTTSSTSTTTCATPACRARAAWPSCARWRRASSLSASTARARSGSAGCSRASRAGASRCW